MSDDNQTLPYPDGSADLETLVIDGEPDGPAPAKRRRWPWVLLVIVVVLAVLGVAAELLARSILPGVVRAVVVQQLDLPADQQLDVEAGGLLVPQLIGGTLDSVRMSTDEITVEGITGAVDMTATGVPLRGGDLGGAKGTVRIDETQFATLFAETELPVDDVAFSAPDATMSGTVTVLGLPVPLALTVTPGIVDGDLELTPRSIELGGIAVDAEQVKATLGGLGQRIAAPQRLCIADQLPAGISITGLSIKGQDAVIGFDVDGAIVTDAALRAKGVCPSS
ncbi:DUF2993 domain-containing protein [Streptomyces sp. AC495_CC817]|uniref:LmeA family phospholipid-binding protein n=1 Tax=Streptomyces sp. AC495_CC817 TaxID=2823900 RepID=UPI001C25D958|nr:DUF2993 domain-containing protein [Streptomyces sp. AC495_CC817]